MNNKEETKKLRPVVFVNGTYAKHGQSDFKQKLLLNAMRITSDPKKLRQMIGVATVADVYRTLDKMALRKDYHKALSKLGLTFEQIAGVIGQEMMEAGKSSDRLNAAKVLLKSLGMDKYDTADVSGGGNWEDLLLEAEENKNIGIVDQALLDGVSVMKEYEVEIPIIPETEQGKKDEETEYGKSLYE